jgi:CRISPR-associated protein Cmr2
LIRSKGGCPIYCGGDDVLALLPLDTALECAHEVNQLFRKKMSGRTFSAGLVVVHGLEPLTEVREWAKRAERNAKDPEKGNRDSICIGLYPRSGGDVVSYDKWDSLIPLIEKITGLYAADKLPRSLAHELRDLLEKTDGWSEIDATIPDLARSIARRKQSQAARDLVEERVTSRRDLETLTQALLLARPFARARKEATPEAAA